MQMFRVFWIIPPLIVFFVVQLGIISNPGITGTSGSNLEPNSQFQSSGTNQDHSPSIYCAEFKKKVTFCIHMH